MSNDDTIRLKVGCKVDGRWQVTRKLGQGAFGAVYEAFDTKKQIPSDGSALAMKLESVDGIDQVLKIEVAVLRDLKHRSKHACTLYASGRNSRYSFLLMTLLGPSLSTLRKRRTHFSRSTTILLARQCLQAIRDLHQVGWLHRDVKPSNFALGKEGKSSSRTIFILDFGLSRTYWMSAKDRTVRPPRRRAGFRGTVRYCSLNAHRNKELGRSDDVISLLYMMVEMFAGTLPWKSIEDNDGVAHCKAWTAKILYSKLMPRLNTVHTHLYTLKYQDTPDYAMLDALLTSALTPAEIEMCPFDWEAEATMISTCKSTTTYVDSAIVTTGTTVTDNDDTQRNDVEDIHNTNYEKKGADAVAVKKVKKQASPIRPTAAQPIAASRVAAQPPAINANAPNLRHRKTKQENQRKSKDKGRKRPVKKSWWKKKSNNKPVEKKSK